MLILVQPIFAPNEEMLTKNINSIESLLRYLKQYPYELKYFTGGWCASVDYWEQIRNTLVDFPSNVEIVYKAFDENYGKAFVVNTLYKEFVEKRDFEYFLTIDSDMIFDITCHDMFDNLLQLAKDIETRHNTTIGMLSLQQHQACCHIIDETWHVENYDTFVVKTPPNSFGLAGGAILTSKIAWQKINGYRVLNVYGGNDGWYLNDCAMYNFWYGLVDNIFMIHPLDKDVKYVEWKKEQIAKLADRIEITELKNRAIESLKIWHE